MFSTNKSLFSFQELFYFKDARLEEKYTRWKQDLHYKQIFYICLLTGSLYILYSLIDHHIAHADILVTMTSIHLFTMAPILFLMSTLAFFKRSYPLLLILVILAPIIASIGNITILSQIEMSTIYLSENYFILLWIFILSGQKLLNATISGLITLLVVLTGTYFFLSLPQDIFIMHSFWMLSSFSFGFLGASLMERSSRTVFIANEQLEEKVLLKTEELQNLNASLETIVEQKVAKITEQEDLMIAQSRLAAMGEMMSMIAHQWRQPLSTTTLMIANEKIKLMMASKELSEYHRILDTISDTMIYLSDTIDDFQTYFKPDKNTEKISICTLVERAHSFMDQRLTLSKVKLDIEECMESSVETYSNEVVQVLINIINNAIDVLLEKRKDDRRIWMIVDSSDEAIMITIEDNGGGIENDIIGQIFEPYFSSKSKNGTGLGLYMAKMIIEKHIGGVLSVVNSNNGACFTLVLPKKCMPVDLLDNDR